jgi:hypothetical protein
MPDLSTGELAAAAGGGAIGGGVAVLLKDVARKQTVASILIGSVLGPAVAVWANEYYGLPHGGSVLIGVVCGLCGLIIVPVVQNGVARLLGVAFKRIENGPEQK